MNCKNSIVLLTSLFLSACGGGGGGGGGSSEAPDTPPSTESVLTGVFVDSPVAGLHYKTASRSGLTDAFGKFEYIAGETVTFSLGNTVLGVAPGANTITPFSLFGIEAPATETEITAALTATTPGSFDRALNVAALLQTFDKDGDPDIEGIDLGNAHALLKNDSINLFVKATSFKDQSDLTSAISKVQSAQIRDLGDTVKHLYKSLNVDVESKLVASFVSEMNTGNAESLSYEYDADGNLLAEIIDRNNDGTPDATKTYDYDSNNNLRKITNSATNTVETLDYDSNNKLLSRRIDNESTQDLLESYQYANNKMTTFQLDKGADGTIDSTTLYNYSPQGELISYTVDSDGDGEVNNAASYTYSNQQVSSFIEDKGNDGTPDLIIVYSYDENGNRASHSIENSSSGEPNSLSRFQYDDRNNIVRYEQDKDLDGNADYIESYAYNQNNQRSLYRRDIDADGKWDSTAQYFYNTNGKRIRMIEDSDGNGIVDKTWTGNYQAAVLDNGWDLILGKL